MAQRKGIGSHQSAKMGKDEWLTPPYLVKALGEFDLDPCAPIQRPWDTARRHYTVEDDGLKQIWSGRVWCNPPYGLEAVEWLDKLSKHGDGARAKANAGAPSVLVAYGDGNAEALRVCGIRGKFLRLKV